MSAKQPDRPRHWSYSAWKQYSECPAQYRFQRIERRPRPSSPAADRGIMIHQKAEGVLRGEISGVPRELSRFRKQLLAMKRLRAEPEVTLYVDHNWKPVDSFEKCWGIMKLDVLLVEKKIRLGTVVDFKSGRPRDYTSQLRCYSAGVFAHYDVETVRGEIYYTDTGVIPDPQYMTRSEGRRMQNLWTKRADEMLTDTKLRPSPGRHCKWCPYRDNPCREWRSGGMGNEIATIATNE